MPDQPNQSGHVDLDDVANYVTALRDVRRRMTELREVEEMLVEQIKQRMGDAPEAHIGGVPVIRWAWTKPVRRFDRKAFAAAHPDLDAEYTVTGEPSRRFVLDPGGEQ